MKTDQFLMIPFPDEDDENIEKSSIPRRSQKIVTTVPSEKNNSISRRRRGSDSADDSKTKSRRGSNSSVLATRKDGSCSSRETTGSFRGSRRNSFDNNYRRSIDKDNKVLGETKSASAELISSLLSPTSRRVSAGRSRRSSAPKSLLSSFLSPTSQRVSADRRVLNPRGLPPPKSPLRLTLQRKSKKANKVKKEVVTKEVDNEYDENGYLQRTTVIKIKRTDGTTSTRRRKELISPMSPKYRKPAVKNTLPDQIKINLQDEEGEKNSERQCKKDKSNNVTKEKDGQKKKMKKKKKLVEKRDKKIEKNSEE